MRARTPNLRGNRHWRNSRDSKCIAAWRREGGKLRQDKILRTSHYCSIEKKLVPQNCGRNLCATYQQLTSADCVPASVGNGRWRQLGNGSGAQRNERNSSDCSRQNDVGWSDVGRGEREKEGEREREREIKERARFRHEKRSWRNARARRNINPRTGEAGDLTELYPI